MELIPEVEALRAELQVRHVEFLQAEINLIFSFVEMARAESTLGFTEAARRSIAHVQQAFVGAYEGLNRIDAPGDRAHFEQKLTELEAFAGDLKIPLTPSPEF